MSHDGLVLVELPGDASAYFSPATAEAVRVWVASLSDEEREVFASRVREAILDGVRLQVLNRRFFERQRASVGGIVRP